MVTSIERKYVYSYKYGWNLGNYNDNSNIISVNAIHNGIQTILKGV